ncbi:MAG: efflux RND transporter permease subunit [Eubacteriales bacterium]|nr:efflux RND transporter permease subunit [Eubacteriales bacterium]
MKIHTLSVRRPVAVIMVIMIFIVLGLYSVSMLPIEMMPEMDFSMAIVYTSYSNVGSQEVENLVTKTIEGAIGSVSGIDTITSQSSEGTSMVMAQFTAGTDMDKAVRSMKDNIDLVSSYLPEDAEKPMVVKVDMSMMPAATMSVSYEGYDLVQTKKYVDDNLKDKLEAVDGVASVSVSGARDRIIEVTVDPEKMFGQGVSFSNVVSNIAMQNANMPAGTTERTNKNLSVRSIGKIEDVKNIDFIPIITPSGQTIYLRDVATVKDTYSKATTYARLNGEDSVSISITAESDANTVNVVNGVIKVLDNAQKASPNFEYNMTMEQASYIEDAIGSVAESAVSGGLLAVLVLILFLGSVKNSLIIGVATPIAVITTFIGMFFSGMSLNVVSLGGLSLGVGMLVDNSVVVLENIFRRRKEYNEDPQTAAMSGTGEVITAILASTITTCIVYVPIMFIDNMMASVFKQLAFAIIFSQVSSLLATLLIVPMLSAKIKDIDAINPKLAFALKPFDKLMKNIRSVYEKVLRLVLRNRKRFVFGTLAVFVVAMFLLTQVGMTLMPTGDEGSVSVTVTTPVGTKLEDTNEITREIENTIMQNKNVSDVSSSVGAASMFATSPNSSTITVALKENRRGTTTDIAHDIRESLSDVSGAVIKVDVSNTAMGMSSDTVEFQFSSTDEAKLEKFVVEAQQILDGIDGIAETETSISETKSEVRIRPDKAKAAMYGFNSSSVANIVKNYLDGANASRFTDSGSEYDIKVVYPKGYVEDYNDLLNLQLDSPTGQRVTLRDIANVSVEKGYTTLTRINQRRVLTLTGKLYDSNMGKVKADFEKELSKHKIPDGVTMETGGSYEVMIDSMLALFVAIILGILLMYMVMAAQFESLIEPLVILGTVPLAMIGVVVSLVVTWSPLSVIGCIGILMLVGIAVSNAIILIEFVNDLKREKPHLSRTDTLVEAGKTRLRPILMTTMASILGFLPMAVSSASGSEMMQPLAVVLLGGLSIGTLLTLLFIPVLYSIFDDIGIRHHKKKQAKSNKNSVSA